MNRLLYITLVLLLVASTTFGQDQPSYKTLPLFGGIKKNEQQQKQDEKFLKSCDASFTTRQEASKFFMDRGWEYLAEGQTDTAMYRFNLAWLLNPDNGDTYWAFGLVSTAINKPDEALSLLERALVFQPSNSLLHSDIASAHLNLYKAKSKKKHIKNANKFLNQAITLDARNAFALYSLSEVKYLEKNYAAAWAYLHQAREIDMANLNYSYLYELIEKMPDPKNFFSSQVNAN
jgi:tetratricopeptide (TPR) repeat protein